MRAQFTKMVVSLLGLPVSEADVPPFADVETPSDSLYPDNYIGAAAREVITRGLSATVFGPYKSLTRAQCITMLVRAADMLHPGALGEPGDDWRGRVLGDDPTHWQNIRRAEYAGLLSGLDLADFAPAAPATRAEVAQIMANLVVQFGPLDVRDFGAKGDGTTNDRDAIQQAMDAAAGQRRTLYFPAGRYKVEFTADNFFLNYGDGYDAHSLTVVGAGEEQSIIDVYPKAIDGTNWYGPAEGKYAVFSNFQSGNTSLTLQDIAFAGPTSYTTAYSDQQADTYLVYAVANTGRTNNVTFDHVKATEGLGFYNGIFLSSGDGYVHILNSAIKAQFVGASSFIGSGTATRQMIIDNSTFDDCYTSADLNSDGQTHGAQVYAHQSVALRVTNSTFTNNGRVAVQEYGGSDGEPEYSYFENVTFENVGQATIVTPKRAILTTIRGYQADAGHISLRNDMVLENGTFTGEASIVKTTYGLADSEIDLTVRNTTFALDRSSAMPTGLGSLTLENAAFETTAAPVIMTTEQSTVE